MNAGDVFFLVSFLYAGGPSPAVLACQQMTILKRGIVLGSFAADLDGVLRDPKGAQLQLTLCDPLGVLPCEAFPVAVR